MALRRFSVKVGGSLVLLLSCLTLALLVAQPGEAVVSTPSPVAAYSFDEGTGTTVEDITGDGHTATIEGAKWARGRYGDGLEFKGSEHDVVKIPASSELNFEEEFTLEAWVRPASSTDKLAPIVGKMTGGGSGSKSLSYYLYAGNSESKPYGEIQHVLGTGKKATATSAPPGATWTHLALTYDGAVERLYVNGVQVAETAAEAPVTTTGELQIGAETEHSEYFSGRIDEVRIYNRVLNGTEVGSDMETPLVTPKQGPVAAYSFDEGTGSTVADITGHGHTATIEGAKWAVGRYGDGLEFKGSEHNVVKIPASSELNFEEEFTLEAWVRPASSTDKLAPILGKTTGGGSGSSKSLSYYLYAGNSESKPYGEVQHVVGTGKKATASSAPPGATWTHLALTYDGSKERLYVNGVQVAETATEAPVTTTGELQIGAETEHGEYFSGRIDEVRIYNRALGAGEVGADMETPIQTPKIGPVAAYSFDEGTGTTVEDITGDGHTATIEEGEWTKGRYGGGIRFTGAAGSKCVSVPDSPELRLSEEFTLEAWVKPVGGIYEDPVVVRESGGKDAFGLGLGSRVENEPEGFIGQGKGSEAAVGGRILANEWTPVATTYDGSRIRVYEEGELVAEETATTPPVTSEGPLKIGCDAPDGQFTGAIDEVRVYNRALNGAEVASTAETPLQTPKATPVAAYSFDEKNEETATDTTGDGHTATVEGAKWTEHGRYGGAIEFDAAEEDVLKIPASPELTFNEEFTLEAWVRPSGEDNHDAPLIDKQEGGHLGYFLYEGGSVSDRPYGAASEEQEFVHADEPLPARAWSHVALTFTGGRTYLYVDGELVDNGAAAPTMTSEGELEIGGSSDTADWFDGRIDEVRIYNRGLDAAEVDADMEAPIQTPKKGPIAAYSFNEGTGTTVEDITGDGHTATIEGAEWSPHGRYGGAMSFDGKGAAVSIPASPELDLTEQFTLEAWIHPEKVREFDDIFSKEESGTTTPFAYLVSDHHGKLATYFDEYPEHAVYSPGQEIRPHVWTHVAVTDDGGYVRLYLNGDLVETGPSPILISTSGALKIGSNALLGPENDFDGRIDEVRIYNRAISAQELDPRWTPDTTPPEIELGGSLAEGLKNGTTSYGLTIDARDGTPAHRGAGIRKVTISVDGEQAESLSQKCPQTNCPLDDTWAFNTEVFGFEPHEISVTAEDQAGNAATASLPVAAPNGSIPACSATESAESPPDEVEALAGGGQVAIYHGEDGERIEFPSPPSGFNPKTATAEELDRYGFPARPSVTETAAYNLWQESVGSVETIAEPGGCMGARQTEFAPPSVIKTGILTSFQEQFGGWAVDDPEAAENKWTTVSETFRQPELNEKSCPAGNSVLVSWVGISGPGGALIQAGTNAPFNWTKVKGKKSDPNHHAAAFTQTLSRERYEAVVRWEEEGKKGKKPGVKPFEEAMFYNLAISPGDKMRTIAGWDPVKKRALVWVEDMENHHASPMRLSPPAEAKIYEGQYLNFTIERDDEHELANFGQLAVYNAEGYLTSGESHWRRLGSLPNRRRVVMSRAKEEKQSGQILSSTSGVSGEGGHFVNEWHHCKP